MIFRHILPKTLIAFLYISLLLIGTTSLTFSEETYVFERMWPTLNQDWYFYIPFNVAVDPSGYVYVLEHEGNRVNKLDPNGRLITKWGTHGAEEGEFSYPNGIAIDSNGNIYVSDTGNHRIQKFSSNGKFLAARGSYGSDPGQFNNPCGIAIDSSDYIYVVDSENHRIQKFAHERWEEDITEWKPDTRWGSEGYGDGKFLNPCVIAIDGEDNIYIGQRLNATESYIRSNCDIQKFTSNGEFILRLEPTDSEYELIQGHNFGTGICTDHNNYVYVIWENINKYYADGNFIENFHRVNGGINATSFKDYLYVSGYHGLAKYSLDGNVLEWWSASAMDYWGQEKFTEPKGVSRDDDGNIWVADTIHLYKHSSNGEMLLELSIRDVLGENDDSLGGYPQDIAISNNGNLYISVSKFPLSEGSNNHIQIRSSGGQFIDSWGTSGTGNSEFDEPKGIALDQEGNVYVVDSGNHRIQKFDTEGNYLDQWGTLGYGDGEFSVPWGIAIDGNDNVYVTDTGNNRVQKFDTDGNYRTQWGSYGIVGSSFSRPMGIEVDESGNVYIVEWEGNRIQKFTSEGDFITKFGDWGTNPEQFRNPIGITVDTAGDKIFVTDHGNSRVQVFKQIYVNKNSKSIIVAGGGPYQGNNLWNATQMCANFAYRTLTYQGYTKNSIEYLTSDTDLDLDTNGEPDDVDGDATNANLQNAITQWATDADSLVIYLVDHGGDGTFRMSGTETLSASDLDSWLDQLQETIPGKVTVIYDACESGSFISQLIPPEGKKRIVIGSTKPGESAYFVSQGSISFSSYFWTHIFNGFDIKNAFDLASQALALTFTTDNQHPLLDANGNGEPNEPEDGLLAQKSFIGNGTIIQGESPLIGSVFDPQTINDKNSFTLYASGVTDNDGIARVWAVIRPPNYYQKSSDNPVYALPSIDLMPVGDDRWEANYDYFNIEGTYNIAIYARDRIGNTAVPKLTTVSVNNPLSRKAIIIAGSWQADKLWPAVERNVSFAYKALNYQGYSDDDIHLLSPEPINGTIVDGDTTLSNLNNALNIWAQQSTQDALLYMITNGNYKSFRINQTEDISAEDLDILLDNLQNSIPGKVTVIYDACRSGSFLEALTPPGGKERILISSSSYDQPAHFLSEGDICFSRFFWANITNGADVYDAFVYAKNAIWYACQGQTPHLDDNGNGIGNEKIDGVLSRSYALGVGIMLAGDNPIIGSISPEQTLQGTASATIWVDVTTTNTIDKVWAIILPPDLGSTNLSDPIIDIPVLMLSSVGNGRYEGVAPYFDKIGRYDISVFAMDIDGNISISKETSVTQLEALAKGDINGDGTIDLIDSILAIQVSCGICPDTIIYNYADANEDNKIGLEEVIYILQDVSGIR